MKWYWWVLIGFALAGLYIAYSYRNRQKQVIKEIEERVDNVSKQFTEEDAKQALKAVLNKYGREAAAQIEKVARLETDHFKSRQYKLAGTGGMEVHGSAPYYGWYSPFFIANPEYTPVGTTQMLEGKGASEIGGNAQSKQPKVFVIMPSVEAWMMFLADYAKRYANEGGILRWYSTKKTAQDIYANSLAGIRTPITNSIV